MARSSRHREKKPERPARRVTARIDDIASAGDGVALIDGGRVYIPTTAPGDVIEVDVRGERGTLVHINEPSPHRADAPCPHYGACGGCSLQHLTAEFYRNWKRLRVIDALAREGLGDAAVAPIIETPAASRRRAVFAVRKSRDLVILGFNPRRSFDVVDIDCCVILHPDLLARLPALRALASKIAASSFDLSVTLADNGLDVVIMGKVGSPNGLDRSALIAAARDAGVVRLSLGDEALVQFASPIVCFDAITVTPPPGAFLQATRDGESALIALVKKAAGDAKMIADLFCGCGTFTLPLAKSATLVAYDSDRISIEALLRSAGAAQRVGGGINPVRAEARDLFERPLPAKELKAFDAIVFDPPRAGAALQAAEIARSGVETVVGVSCNPTTFARDAAILVQGGYTLSQATPVDQFVYSAHVEIVGIFRRG